VKKVRKSVDIWRKYCRKTCFFHFTGNYR